MKKVALFLAFLILCLCAQAREDVVFTALQDNIYHGVNAKFVLHIYNDELNDREFLIRSSDLNWDLVEREKHVMAGGKETKDVEVEFKPLSDLKPGNYGINLVVSSGEDKFVLYLPVKLLSKDEILDVSLSVAEIIDVGKENTIKFIISNLYNFNLGEVKFLVRSEILSAERTFDLGPNGKKEINLVLPLNKDIQFGKHPVSVKVLAGENLLLNKVFDLNVGQHSDLKEANNFEKSFFIYKEVIILTNEGNAVEEVVYSKKLSLLQRLFTSFSPKPNLISKVDGSYVASWVLDLDRSESMEIKVTTNYRMPLIILVAVVLGVLIAHHFLKRSVRIDKKAIAIKSAKGVMKLRVTINLKNTSRNIARGLRVVDRVPNIISKPSVFGVKPAKISEGGKGVNLVWDLGELSPDAVRVLSYVVEARTDVNGKLVLPATVLRYTEKGKTFMNKSRRIYLS